MAKTKTKGKMLKVGKMIKPEKKPTQKDEQKAKKKKELKRLKDLNTPVPYAGASKEDCDKFFAKSLSFVLFNGVSITHQNQ